MPPEGLDEAREAFAQEIPNAERPRDQSGKFVSTSSKPEPIFQPRDVEGDEHGDTRDGGPDPRLLELEQRVADGRGEDEPEKPKKGANDNTQTGNDNEHPDKPKPEAEEDPNKPKKRGRGRQPPLQGPDRRRGEGGQPQRGAARLPARGNLQPPHGPDGRGRQDHRSARRGGPPDPRRLHPALSAPGARVPGPDPPGAQLGRPLQAGPGGRSPARTELPPHLRHARPDQAAARGGAARGLPAERAADRLLSRGPSSTSSAPGTSSPTRPRSTTPSPRCGARCSRTASARTRSARPTTSG